MAVIDIAGLVATDIATSIPEWTVGVNLFANRAPAVSKLPDPNARYCVILPSVVTRNGVPTALHSPAPFIARLAVRVIAPVAGDAFNGASGILDNYISVATPISGVSVWSDTALPVLIGVDSGGRTEYGGTLSVTWDA